MNKQNPVHLLLTEITADSASRVLNVRSQWLSVIWSLHPAFLSALDIIGQVTTQTHISRLQMMGAVFMLRKQLSNQ